MDSLDANLIIKGIHNQDKTILDNVYKEYFPLIKKLVLRNNGNSHDAEDVFQEGIIVIYRKIKETDFELTCSFSSYLYSVCRYIWIKQLSKNKEYQEKLSEYIEYEGTTALDEDEYEKHEEYLLFQKHFNRLGKDCKKIITMFLKKSSFKEIAAELGAKSLNYIKTRKYKCKKQLVKYIKSDPEFNGERVDGK